MYKSTKIRLNILQCHGNYMELKKINYMLEIDFFRNSSQKQLGVLRGAFERFRGPKDTQTSYWLRLWFACPSEWFSWDLDVNMTHKHPDTLLAKTLSIKYSIMIIGSYIGDRSYRDRPLSTNSNDESAYAPISSIMKCFEEIQKRVPHYIRTEKYIPLIRNPIGTAC